VPAAITDIQFKIIVNIDIIHSVEYRVSWMFQLSHFCSFSLAIQTSLNKPKVFNCFWYLQSETPKPRIHTRKPLQWFTTKRHTTAWNKTIFDAIYHSVIQIFLMWPHYSHKQTQN